MKATASAPANIAFIKYWGKTDKALRIPANSSFSMNLSHARTLTTVEFSEKFPTDLIDFIGEESMPGEHVRIINHIDRLRSVAQIKTRVKIVTKNSFPKGTGIASSASGFAALTVATVNALGLPLAEKDITVMARLGSGSACRSIPDGYVVWEKGTSSETSIAHSIAPAEYWDLRDVLVVVDQSMKKVSTSAGHDGVTTSPLWEARLKTVEDRLARTVRAFLDRRFAEFGELVEADCLNMHSVMQSQNPPLYYWTDGTKSVMEHVRAWRKSGLPVFFTIDAGPNVHIICEAVHEKEIVDQAKKIPGILSILVNKPSVGAQIQETHLF